MAFQQQNNNNNQQSSDEKDDVYSGDTDFGDVDDLGNTDIKINPDYYIHMGIVRAQKALSNGDYLSYLYLINNVETLCRAANKLDDVYLTKLNEFKATIDVREKQAHPLTNDIRIAEHKLFLMMQSVFDNKQVTGALKTA